MAVFFWRKSTEISFSSVATAGHHYMYLLAARARAAGAAALPAAAWLLPHRHFARRRRPLTPNQ